MKNKLLYGLFVCVFGLVLLTGCGGGSDSGKKVSCTADLEENGTKYGTAEIIAKLDDSDKVTGASMVMHINDEKMAQQLYSMFTLMNSFAEDDSQKIDAKLEGKDIKINNLESYLGMAEDGKELIGISKTDFITEMEKEESMKVVCK